MSSPRYGLTIIQPWATLIVEGPKAIENRCWAPPPWIVGQVIAIHAGKKWDDAGEDAAHGSDEVDIPALSTWKVRGAIIGTARVVGCVRQSEDPWFAGPYGWLLAERRKLAPFHCRGAQKLWAIDTDIIGQLLVAT